MTGMLHGHTGPFHDGELALQRATGEREIGARNGRIIADHVIPAAAGFIGSLPLAVAATLDGDGRPWCSALVGPPGTFTVQDLTRLTIGRAAGGAGDPLWANLAGDPRIGLLFIEPATRRRYRVNGRVADSSADPLVVEVAEALPNCPKYIARRHLAPDDRVGTAGPGATGPVASDGLGDADRRLIAAADLCFVASANPAGHLDASHRGGRPGFVEWRDGRLWVPDYPGNSMFNTLGNLRVHPRAGLLFVDFAAAGALQLTGTTSIDLAASAAAPATGGTGRAWTFSPTARRLAPLPLRDEFLDFSPFNP
ncbi:MAG TPA: pyridoxamine 5'-phosphate oxidase family protein [Acidimicrobiia bacterium]|nr:pyridoxamine 5'-phosphate oxidase family protein [Acidimicrobiia bacterium]